MNDLYVFEIFLSLHHLVVNLFKNVDERDWNIMCVLTSPSLLVNLKSTIWKHLTIQVNYTKTSSLEAISENFRFTYSFIIFANIFAKF